MLRGIEFLPDATLGFPRSWSELPEVAAGLERDDLEALAQRLEAGLSALGAHVRSVEAARALAAPGARCVVTVVHPALLGPRLGGLWSALACVRAAEELARHRGTPVVPLAWIGGDLEPDPELARAWVPNPRHELQRVALPGTVRDADLPLDEGVHRLGAIRALLRQLYGDARCVDAALELLTPRSSESLGAATRRALHGLLGQRGLVAIDPEWLREEASRALASWVAETPVPPLLRTLGGEAVIARHRETGALRAAADGYRYDREPGSRTAAELAAEIVQEPSAWLPGDALLPVVLGRALPVAARVGEWEELAIHARFAALAAELGRATVPLLPRARVTLVDEETDRALARSGRSAREALAGPSADPGPVPAEPEVLIELRAIAEAAFRELAERRGALGQLEPSLAGQLARAIAQARAAIERVLGKAERLAADRSGRGRRYARRIGTVLRPLDQPQERALGLFTFAACYGTDWIDAMLAEWDPLAPEHLVVHLGTTPDR